MGGFDGKTWANLHVRWVEASAFMYPFFRDHSSIGQDSHELYHWGEPYTSIMRDYVNARQRIHSYQYTLMLLAHYKGYPILRSIFMEFPDDFTTARIDTQAMVGPSLLVSPVLEDNSTVVGNVYFPCARWYDFWTNAEDPRVTNGTRDFVDIEGVELDQLLVHIRGGTIHTQQQHNEGTTVNMAEAPLTVVVALDEQNRATGELIVDDGITDDDARYSTVVNSIFRVELICEDQVLQTKLFGDFKTNQKIERFFILGLAQSPSNVTVVPDSGLPYKASFDPNTKVLTIECDGAGPDNVDNGFPLNVPVVVSWN